MNVPKISRNWTNFDHPSKHWIRCSNFTFTTVQLRLNPMKLRHFLKTIILTICNRMAREIEVLATATLSQKKMNKKNNKVSHIPNTNA
jgi:hypothetical protein